MVPEPTNDHTHNYRDQHLAIYFDQQAVLLDNQKMKLTRKEYDLLALLVLHAGEIIPREALLMRIWGYGADIRTRTLDVHVRRLRKKLDRYSDPCIQTILGVGYRFQPSRESQRMVFAAPVKPAVAVGA